jgi:SnoaL-like domain
VINELPPAVSRLLDAANAHNTDAFLAAFTADGVVDDWGREFSSPEAIRGWSDSEFIGVDVSLSVTEVDVTDDEAMILAEVGGSGYTGPSHFMFASRDGLVSRMTIRQ